MAFIKSKGITAKEEPNPRSTKQRVVPHYLYLPDQAYGDKGVSFTRTYTDVQGYFDKRSQKNKNQDINYLFLKGQATPVWNETHVHALLDNLKQLGVVEVAWTPGPDKVENFHPERTKALDIKLNGTYNLEESFEVVTKTFKPVLTKVIRTPDDIENGRKLELTEKERKYTMDDILGETAAKPAKGSKGAKK